MLILIVFFHKNFFYAYVAAVAGLTWGLTVVIVRIRVAPRSEM